MIESKAWAEVIYPKISPFYPERLVKIGFLQMHMVALDGSENGRVGLHKTSIRRVHMTSGVAK